MHIFHALFTPGPGGMEQAYINTTEVFTELAHRVTCALQPDAVYGEQVRFYTQDIVHARPVGFYDPFSVWKIRRQLKVLKPDVIVAHNARAISLMHAAARGTGIPVIGVCHSYKTDRIPDVSRIVVLTEDMRRHFVAKGFAADRISVIGNYVKLEAEPAFKSMPAKPTIGAMGRLAPEKGFDIFLKALSKLDEKNIAFNAVIAGEGPEEASLKELALSLGISAQVEFSGWVKDKAMLFSGIDIFCVPSTYEPFGLVVLEGIAHGKPVIASNVSGPASIIQNDSGVLVEAGNERALADAIHTLITHPDAALEIARKGWQRVQDYSFDAISEEWNRVLKLTLLT